nr:unnamed protein product [Naegleria fowleri]
MRKDSSSCRGSSYTTPSSDHHHWYVDENFVSRSELFPIMRTIHDDQNLHFDIIHNIQNNMYFYLMMMNQTGRNWVGINKKVVIKDDMNWDCIIYQQHQEEPVLLYRSSTTTDDANHGSTFDELPPLPSSPSNSDTSTEKDVTLPIFIITFPLMKRKLCAHKHVLQQFSHFFDTMFRSEMIECSNNEMAVKEDEKVVELVMDFLHLGWIGLFSRDLLTSLQNVSQCVESVDYTFIGMSEMIQLLEKADEYSIPCLVEAIAQTMNEFNAMIFVKRALSISEELRTILLDHASHIVAENMSCMIADHIYDCEIYREKDGSWSIPIEQQIKEENNIRRWCEQLSITKYADHLVLFQQNLFIHAFSNLPSEFLLKVLKSKSFSENTHDTIAYICMWLLQNFNGEEEHDILRPIFLFLYSLDLSQCSMTFVDLFIVRIFMEFLKMSHLTEELHFTSSLLVQNLIMTNQETQRQTTNEFQQAYKDPFSSVTYKLVDAIETDRALKEYALNMVRHVLSQVLLGSFLLTDNNIFVKNGVQSRTRNPQRKHIARDKHPIQKVLLLGLDDCGKTRLLYKLTNKENEDLFPTIGYNAEAAQYGPVFVNIWDIGGSIKMRPLWKQFVTDCDMIIYVIDASNSERFQEAKESLDSFLEFSHLKPGCTFVIYANKMDLVKNVTHTLREIRNVFSEKYSKFISDYSEMDSFHDITLQQFYTSKLHIQSCSALTGDGISSGFEILFTQFPRQSHRFGEIAHILEYIDLTVQHP